MTRNLPARYGGEPVREDPIGYGGQHITENDKNTVANSLDGDYITRGPTVEEFETRVADLVGVKHAVAATSGTTALHLAGEAAGFGSGDEVITTPLTYVSSAFPAIYTGATPELADIDPHTRTIDPDRVREKITEDTTGLVPMHYGGYPAYIDELLNIAQEHDLTVIWDACHGFGSTYRGNPAGSHPDMAVFSFHPVKTVTTGEGGMVVTDNDDLAAAARQARSFKMDYNPDGHEDEPWYQVVEDVGYNYNFTDIQAALGLSQLDKLDEFKRRRDEIIERYNGSFERMSGIRTPPEAPNSNPVYHLYAVEIQEGFGCTRKEFVNAMHDENIYVQVHYVPLHYHPYFQEEYGLEKGDFPNSEAVYDGLVSLPLFPAMTEDDVTDVIRAIQRIQNYH